MDILAGRRRGRWLGAELSSWLQGRADQPANGRPYLTPFGGLPRKPA
jgi:hypothetical protein